MSPMRKGEKQGFTHPLYFKSHLRNINRDRVPDHNKSFDEENTQSWMSSSIDLS